MNVGMFTTMVGLVVKVSKKEEKRKTRCMQQIISDVAAYMP